MIYILTKESRDITNGTVVLCRPIRPGEPVHWRAPNEEISNGRTVLLVPQHAMRFETADGATFSQGIFGGHITEVTQG